MGGKRSNQEYGRLLYHRYWHTHLHTLSLQTADTSFNLRKSAQTKECPAKCGC